MKLGNTMELGTLIDQLKQQPADNVVRFNFGHFRPKGIDSYRGYYEHLAIGYTEDTDRTVTAGDLAQILEQSIGVVFHGWKGGEYRAHREAEVYVANRGEAPGTTILSVRSEGGITYLMTGNEEVD